MTTTSNHNPMLRHVLKTIQYRLNKVLDGAPGGFGSFSIHAETRTPIDILSHISDVLGFAMVQFEEDWKEPDAGNWNNEISRYHATLADLDKLFGATVVSDEITLRLVQGPLADVLTHIGQLAMLRRLAGVPVEGENYFVAELPDVLLEESR